MQRLKKRSCFIDSEEAEEVREKLKTMTTSDLYNTQSSFNADGVLYPGNLISFQDKHMNYLNAHPMLDVSMYLANLRLKTRIR